MKAIIKSRINKLIIALILCISISCSSFHVIADNSSVGDEVVKVVVGLGDYFVDGLHKFGTNARNGLWSVFNDDYCGYSYSGDGHHSYSVKHTAVNGVVGYYYICDLCGKTAGEVMDDAYTDYVSDLPATSIDSEGGVLWYPTVSDIDWSKTNYYSLSSSGGGSTAITSLDAVITQNGNPHTFSVYDSRTIMLRYEMKGAGTSSWSKLGYNFNFLVPMEGVYSRIASLGIEVYNNSGGTLCSANNTASSGSVIYTGNSINSVCSLYQNQSPRYNTYGYLYLPVYRIVPLTGPVNSSSGMSYNGDTIYNIDSRPTSISGDLAYYNTSGDLTLSPTGTIVNETDNSVYNPVTDTTYDMSSWCYDYSDRSYTVTTTSGDTMTVTYGDQNITISEGGDTYNIYYVVDPSTAAHTHDYVSAVTSEATCTASGTIQKTCSICGDTQYESIPPLGHDWQVKTHVATTYDDAGNILTDGFTIYRCSRCGEEYRSTDSIYPTTPSAPPGSSSGTGSGDSSEDSSGLLSKLGELFGTVFGGLFSLLGAVLSKILDALISLLELIGDKLVTVVETILGFFDELPAIFSGFLDFMTVAFGWLPEEITTLLIFGIAAVVVIGIIKALRR